MNHFFGEIKVRLNLLLGSSSDLYPITESHRPRLDLVWVDLLLRQSSYTHLVSTLLFKHLFILIWYECCQRSF